MITFENVRVTEPVTDDAPAFGYGTVVSPDPRRVIVRVPRTRTTLAQRLHLVSPGFDEHVEERWHWSCSVGGYVTAASWQGYSLSHQAAWDESGELLHAWSEAYDRRPSILAWQAAHA